MDLISEHFYCQQKPDLIEHVKSIPDEIRRIADAHRRYRNEFANLKGKNIRIALDEWNYWYGEHLYGELGTRYFLKDALGIAAGLHEFFRNSDLYFMANYAQTVNVIGAIKTNKTAAEMETTGLALALYRRHFGVLPAEDDRRKAARRVERAFRGQEDSDRIRRESHGRDDPRAAERPRCGVSRRRKAMADSRPADGLQRTRQTAESGDPGVGDQRRFGFGCRPA